ncbi:MAG: 2-amino-4-hydroxy-6-hydroxymethyldihydropteridine diphosphokinase [Ignavibacteria bacterium]
MINNIAYLGLGSNVGDKLLYIERAVSEIMNLEDCKIIISSSVYETEPWGKKNQDSFLNSVIQIETGQSAESLLKQLKYIEAKIGRTDNAKWAEREIDIDLLFYGNEIIKKDTINIPHGEVENRKFVMIPMCEISPDFVHPVLNKTISQLLKETNDSLSVIKFNNTKYSEILGR